MPLVERLVSAGLLSKKQLDLALRERVDRDEPLGQVLVRLGMISSGILDDCLDDLLDEDNAGLANVIPDPAVSSMLPEDLARRHNVLPVRFDIDQQVLTLAVPGLLDLATMDELAAVFGHDVAVVTQVAAGKEIESAIERCYRYECSIPGIVREIDACEHDVLGAAVENAAYSHPLVRLVDAILADAAKRGASAIHCEPEAGFVRVRYRIDGVLRQVMALHLDYWPGMAERLKILARTQPAIAVPHGQLGFAATCSGRPINVSISSGATIRGENIVVRMKDRRAPIQPLPELGLNDGGLASLQLLMARPTGLIMITGPADSGKTSTLYSMLNYRNDESVKIMTLEDPVEQPVAMVQQCSSASVSADGNAIDLQHILSQDADIVVLDEINSGAKAKAALALAQSGHQVLATLNASSAVASLLRLMEFGIAPERVAANVVGIVGQRLVRRLCAACRRTYTAERTEREILGIGASGSRRLYRDRGCAVCDFVGYKGRLGVFEVFNIAGELQHLVACGASQRALQEAAKQHGSGGIAEDAVRHVLAGVTSLSEISRTVDLTPRLSKPA